MKNRTLLLGGLSFSAMAALGLIACGDSSSSSGNPLEFKKGDLPACATNTDGSLLIVEGKLQQCMGKDTTWQEILCDKGKKACRLHAARRWRRILQHPLRERYRWRAPERSGRKLQARGQGHL